VCDRGSAQNSDTDLEIRSIRSYQGGPNAMAHGRVKTNTTEYMTDMTMIGTTTAIYALKILGSAGGMFDAGTYAALLQPLSYFTKLLQGAPVVRVVVVLFYEPALAIVNLRPS
jgi:hypothetical protein